MKPVTSHTQENKFEYDAPQSVHTPECNSTTDIAAAVIRSFNRLSDPSTKHIYTTTLTQDKFLDLCQRLNKILPNFNIAFADPTCDSRKNFFDDLLEHIATMQTPSIELLKTLHTMEEVLHGSDHLRKVEATFFHSGVFAPK